MREEGPQVVDASSIASLDQKPSVVMTETMPGPIPRQLSKKTELETITEKHLATSPLNINSEAPATASASSSPPTSTASPSENSKSSPNDGEGELNVEYGNVGKGNDPSPAKLRKERPSSKFFDDDSISSSESDEEDDDAGLGTKTPRARPIPTTKTSSDDEEDEKLGTKTPRPIFTLTRGASDDDTSSSSEEVGTKTPKPTLSLSRPQVSKRKSSLKEKRVESASDEDPVHLSDDDFFDNEKAFANATNDTDLNAVERDVESRDEDLHIRLMQMPGRRHLTIFEGLGDEYDHKKLLKELKRTFACNGNVKKSPKTGSKVIILQGDHCQDLRDFLIGEGVSPKKIRMHNF